jgi:hypothetical protein
MLRIALILIPLLAACTRSSESRTAPSVTEASATAETTSAEPPAPIRTDRSAYVLTNGSQGLEATIVATLRAPTDQTLYILNCNGQSGVTLQRRNGETWEYAWVIAMNACMSAPIVVPPGGEHTGQIYLHERAGAVVEPKGARMLESGTYRVVWTGVLTAFDPKAPGFGGPELPLEQRVSAPFTLEVPQ